MASTFISVSKANSIILLDQTGDLQTFDNRLTKDQWWNNAVIYGYCQKYLIGDEVTIQVKVDTTVESLDMTAYNEAGASTIISGVKMADYPGYVIFEFIINFSTLHGILGHHIYFDLTHGGDTVTSNPVEIIDELEADSDLLKIEWFNDENAFELDYSTGISMMCRVEGLMKDYIPGGKAEVYDNFSEKVKLREEVYRGHTLKIPELPSNMVEKLTIAAAHDNFYINEVQFVSEDKPEIGDLELANLFEFSLKVIQKTVIGLNTHDTGFDCDTVSILGSMVLEKLAAASGQHSFTVPEGYLVLTFTAYRKNGTINLKAGTTPAGDELVLGMDLDGTTTWGVVTIGQELGGTGPHSIYVEVTGSGASVDIFILLIYNRQT